MYTNLKIVLAMVIWGSLGLIVRAIDLPSMEISFVRAVVSGLALLVVRLFINRKMPKYTLKDTLIMIASGLALGLNWILLFTAYRYTSISNATISYYMAPIFAVLLARLLLKEELTVKKIVSMVVSVMGLVLIISQSGGGHGGEGNMVYGVTAGLSAAVFYALIVVSNRAVKSISSLDKTLIQLLTSAVILTPFVALRGQLAVSSPRMALLLFVIGIVHTLVPYLLYFDNIKKVSVLNSAVLSYVDPVSALLFGYVFFQEPLTLYHLMGGLLIMSSALFAVEIDQTKVSPGLEAN